MGSSPVYDLRQDGAHDIESGYVSGSSSSADLPEIYFTKPHLVFLNRQLQNLEPQGRIPPCQLINIFTNVLGSRDSAMVYHNPTSTLSRDGFRPHWSHYYRHAFKDEDPTATDGRSSLLRHSPQLQRDSRSH